MNLSETTFVLPATDLKAQFRLRIFTPGSELPLAGHPVVGTCFILAERGIISLEEGTNRIHQECGAGVLPVDIIVKDGKVDQVVMTQSPPRFFDEYTDRKLLADSVGLSEDQLLPDDLPAQVVSTAVPQLMVPARSLRHMDKMELDLVAMRKILAATRSDSFMIFTRECVHDESTVHARMFAPTMGITEDPATGSASGALGAYLVRRRSGGGRAHSAHPRRTGLRDGAAQLDPRGSRHGRERVRSKSASAGKRWKWQTVNCGCSRHRHPASRSHQHYAGEQRPTNEHRPTGMRRVLHRHAPKLSWMPNAGCRTTRAGPRASNSC